MSHPVHSAIVHFPIACWSLATFGDLASIHFEEQAWWISGLLHVIGVSTAIIAMVTGLIELVKIDTENKAANLAHLHMTLAISSWSVYATTLFLRLDGTSLTAPDPFEISLSILGFLLLCGTGWLGGKMVYEHAIGVKIVEHNKI
jgi:uncharacterized membrane protein